MHVVQCTTLHPCCLQDSTPRLCRNSALLPHNPPPFHGPHHHHHHHHSHHHPASHRVCRGRVSSTACRHGSTMP
jgi:hypothetical protein